MNGPISPFPRGVATWQAKWEKLLKSNLTLKKIESIERQIEAETTDKTRGVAHNLLNQCEARKPALIDRQITLLNQATDLPSKITLLTPLIGYLDSEAIESRIEAIEVDASLEKNQKVQLAAKKQLEHLRFAQTHPVIFDLDEFINQVRIVGQKVLKLNALAPMYQAFNTTQLREIARGGA